VSKPFFPEPPAPNAKTPFRSPGASPGGDDEARPRPVVVRRVEPVEDRFAPEPVARAQRAAQPSNPAKARLEAERSRPRPEVEAMSPESRRRLADSLIAVDNARQPLGWRTGLAVALVALGVHGTGLTSRFRSHRWDYWYVPLILGLVLGVLEWRASRKRLGL
jgi:hypothetical protein